MIRAIFFASNDLVSGSVLLYSKKKIYHELTACSFKEIALVITLVNKNIKLSTLGTSCKT